MASKSKHNRGFQGEIKHKGVVWPSRSFLHRVAPLLEREIRGRTWGHRAAEKGRKDAQRMARTTLDLTARSRGISRALPKGKGSWLKQVGNWLRGKTGKG